MALGMPSQRWDRCGRTSICRRSVQHGTGARFVWDLCRRKVPIDGHAPDPSSAPAGPKRSAGQRSRVSDATHVRMAGRTHPRREYIERALDYMGLKPKQALKGVKVDKVPTCSVFCFGSYDHAVGNNGIGANCHIGRRPKLFSFRKTRYGVLLFWKMLLLRARSSSGRARIPALRTCGPRRSLWMGGKPEQAVRGIARTFVDSSYGCVDFGGSEHTDGVEE